MLERLFHLREQGARARIEVLGGVTTFVTMAYIIVVNPAILAFAGIPAGPGTVATILTAIFGSLLMGVWANRPIAVAPYMGENAFIAFGLTAMGFGWAQCLGAVFVSGVVFLIVTLLGIRGWLARAVSPSLKYGFAAGVGLFLALIGLYETGIVTSAAAGLKPEALLVPGTGLLRAPDVPLRLGDLRDPEVLLAIFGFVVIAALTARGVRGGLLLGMAITAALGVALGHGEPPRGIVAMPFAGEYAWGPVLLKLDIAGVFRASFLPVLLTLFLMSFLDTLGTLVGVGAAGGMLDERGDFPRIERPMTVDALACMFAGLAGTSTSGAYIESAAGIRDGARTGLAAVVTAALFAVALFFLPLAASLQHLRYAYGPALVVVGATAVASIARVRFDDPTELIPVFATLAMMAFTYNIANGLTVGLVLWPALKLVTGRWREVSGGAVVMALLCLAYYVFGLPH